MNDGGTKTFGEAVRRRIAMILLVVGLFGVAAWFVYRQTPPTYQASSQLYVDVSGNNSSNVDPSNNLLNSYWVQQATSERVLQSASYKLGQGEAAQTLQDSVSTNVIRSTNVLQVTARAGYPQQAADRANAVAQAAVAQNQADASKRNVQQLQVLNNRVAQLAPQIQSAQAAVAANPNDLAKQTRLTSLYQGYNDTQSQLTQLQINTANQMNALRIIQQATVPVNTSGPDPRLYVGGGLLFGLIVAVLVAMLLERFDDRVWSTGGLAQVAGTSLVVEIPASRRREGSERSLYTLALAHLFARHPEARRVLAVGVSPDHTAAQAADQLGLAAAMLGRKAQVLGTPSGDETISDAKIHQTETHETEGTMTAAGGYVGHGSTVTLLYTAGIRRNVGDAEHGASDVTIIAVPSPLSSPAAVTAGRQADVAVLVVTAARTKLSQVRPAAQALRAVGLDIGAAILSRPAGWRRWLRAGRGAPL